MAGELAELKMQVAALQQQLHSLEVLKEKPVNGNKSALALLQTVMLAALLGVTGWVAHTTVANSQLLARMQTLLDERGASISRIQGVQDTVLKTLALHSESIAIQNERLKQIEVRP